LKRKKDLRAFQPQPIDGIEDELVLYISYLPPPISIDTLVSLSGASVLAVLNTIEKLKAMGFVAEKKNHIKGLYFLAGGPRPVGRLSEPAAAETGRNALKKILHFYDTSAQSMDDNRTVDVAELCLSVGTLEELPIVKKAADILARCGQDEKAVQYYDVCLRSMTDQTVMVGNATDFLDCVLGRVSLLIYHMSAQDELSLLNRARKIAIRFRIWDRLARIEVVMAQILQTLGEHEKAYRCFNHFLKLSHRIDDHKMVRSAILVICEFLFWRGKFSEVVAHYEKMIGSLEEFGNDEASLKAAALVGYCFVICGRIARGFGIIDAVRSKGALLDLQQVTIFADQMTVLSLFELRRTSEAEPYLSRLFDLPEKALGHLISRGINDERAYILCAKGDFSGAFEYHQKGVKHARSLGWKHHPGSWTFEFLDVLESKGFVDEEVNYDSEIERLVEWDDLRMKGAAFRYRALRNMERKQALGGVLSDLRTSERYLKQAGAEVELARTRIALGRYFLKKDEKTAISYLELAWSVLSRIDKNLFPKDLLGIMPEERKFEATVEKMIQINESLGTIRDQTFFLEKVIEAAMDSVMATRGAFITVNGDDGLKITASRNLDPLLFETDRFKMVRALVAGAALNHTEIVFPPHVEEGDRLSQREDQRTYRRVFRQAGIQSFIGMPAQLAGQTYGYLCLDNRLGGEPFSHNQLPLVRFLCSQISVGLSNLDTYREMKDLKNRFEEEAIFYKREMGIAATTEIICGQSEGMKNVINRIHRAAPTDSSVLITGETGVGKELVAKAIHNLSNRKDGPFIPVNLASIPSELVASELFGHEKGAFTGAHVRQKGRFELADGGTIFLDEVGDLPQAVQVNLLRVLQEGTFERLGSAQSIRSDFRVVAATNKNLAREVENGTFRQDLYYRLDVFPIHVPSLRERKEDIPDLVRHFADKFSKKLGKRLTRIPREEMKKLINHTWPGNVRELEHRVEQAIILSDSGSVSFPEPAQFPDGGIAAETYGRRILTLEELERDYVERILNITHWRVMGKDGAALLLGMKPTTLFYRMKKLGLKRTRKTF